MMMRGSSAAANGGRLASSGGEKKGTEGGPVASAHVVRGAAGDSNERGKARDVSEEWLRRQLEVRGTRAASRRLRSSPPMPPLHQQ